MLIAACSAARLTAFGSLRLCVSAPLRLCVSERELFLDFYCEYTNFVYAIVNPLTQITRSRTMSSQTVNISFQSKILKEIDQVANEESRSRSELIREAARQYIDHKKRWHDIFDFGDNQAKKLNLSETDVSEAIREYRENKK